MTRYRYRNPVALGEHRMMFRPRESYDQRLISTHLLITPTPTQLRYMQDVFGNTVGIANFSGRTDSLQFVSQVELEHTPLPAFHDIDGGVGVYRGVIPFEYAPEDLPDLRRSIQPQYPDPDDVLNDDTLDIQEKRAILSSWASDACAVESVPALRRPPGTEQPISFDQIMDALCRLDRAAVPSRSTLDRRHSFDRMDA